MRLSIITINYNNLAGLRRTIDSVMAQTWRDFEWIIIDGGSTDGSRELIEATAARPEANITYWCSEPDKGVYNAMNKGIAHVTAHSTLDTTHSTLPTPHYLNFMNSGDCYHEATTLEQVFAGKEYDADVLYGDANYIYPESAEIHHYPNPLPLEFFLQGCTVNHQSAFIRLEVQNNHMYSEKYKICSDLLFFLKCKVEKKTFTALEMVVADFYADGMSHQQSDLVWRENEKIYQEVLGPIYFPKDIQLLTKAYNKRRLYKRIIHFLASLLK